ncbi:META domain-containing protein [Micromonospora sp. CPCC 206061]|uniref:META domain-containing protein n=1 Tax=Micromonospora sp. CPCC 206061 TaxID=3122410 RepID=UPI002FEEBFE5
MSIVLSAVMAGSGNAAVCPDPTVWQRTFRSVSVTENGQPRALVPGTRIRIAFPDGKVDAGAGCGQISGAATMNGAQLVVSGVNLLRNSCTDDAGFAQDIWLAAFLDRDPTVKLRGHRLVLTDGRIRLTLTDSPDVAQDPPLIGTYWVLEAVVVNGVTTAPLPFPQPYLVFNANGTLVAFAGCNWVSGSAVFHDGGAVLGEAGITKRGCPIDNPLLETRVHNALDAGEVTLQIEAGRLTVDRAGGPALLLRSES